jgi:hypothetical protein
LEKHTKAMLKKTLFVSLFIFLSRLLISCTCPEVYTYEIEYTDVEIVAYDTSGSQEKEVQDSVFKNTFILRTHMLSQERQLAVATPGFSSARAISCPESTYLYADPISGINLFMIDPENQLRKNANAFFLTYSYHQDKSILLEEYMTDSTNMGAEYWIENLQLELISHDSIPQSAIFEIEVQLQSGKLFTSHTPEIHFYE